MSDYNGPSESVRVRFTRDWFDVKAGTECVATWYPELKHHYVCVPSSDREALRNGQIYGNHPLHDGLLERVDVSLPRKGRCLMPPTPDPRQFPIERRTTFCCWNGEQPCVCSETEQQLRAFTDGLPSMGQMTPAQREWCLAELDTVEGWKRGDHEQDADHELARAVLDAWRDYARDKGCYA